MRKFDFDTWENFKEKVEGNKLVLFGASSGCRHFFEKKENEYQVAYIVDNDSKKWGQQIYGKEIKNPNVLKEEDSKNIIVLIVSVYIREIADQLESLGITNYYSWRFLNTVIYKADTDQYAKEFEKVKNLLADEESKKIYEEVIERRKNGSKDYRSLCSENHYFPEGIIEKEENEVFVDCGAYDGDSIIKFKEWSHNKYKQIFAFEPTRHTYQKLVNNLYKDEKSICILAGVWDKETKMTFYENESVAGANGIRENGQAEICCITLDEVLGSEKITFIKMDVEGAEQRALIGASNIIKRDKPKLAVSIYHSLEDLWKVPSLIHEIVPEYQLYIRHHDILPWETVVYAVPPNK